MDACIKEGLKESDSEREWGKDGEEEEKGPWRQGYMNVTPYKFDSHILKGNLFMSYCGGSHL